MIVKNILDSLTGAIGFWMSGFAFIYGERNSNSFMGIDNRYFFSHDLDELGTLEDLWLKWFYAFAFVNTASTIVSGLLTEKCRIEIYALFSFLMSAFIYPIVAHWAWDKEGWLY